ncbi:hypothetical protein [Ileibacterium valens]|uniref:hypothetical protein n=1 Tax=Ileibacterium valens TaxID=1862668 RepID=UPI002731E906|nr:hypothetical protein [Ileibacterium valens]
MRTTIETRGLLEAMRSIGIVSLEDTLNYLQQLQYDPSPLMREEMTKLISDLDQLSEEEFKKITGGLHNGKRTSSTGKGF